jgi:glycosyltransferase involved in cell wall biosynthesis
VEKSPEGCQEGQAGSADRLIDAASALTYDQSPRRMKRVRSLLRWLFRGESNVTDSLAALSADIRDLQRRVDEMRVIEPISPPPTIPQPSPAPDPWLVSPQRSPQGINLVGYLQHQLGLGDFGRRMAEVLAAGSVEIAPIAFSATASPLLPAPFPTTQRVDNANTIAVVAADQLPVLKREHPEIFDASDRMIGYCFWELSTLSEQGARGVELVDEVWACTTFVADVFERLGTVPVRHVPVTIAEPKPSARSRDSFAPFAAAADRVVFGVTFDHFSVMERKNPLAAIDAFRRAIPANSGALLVVKTLNSAVYPVEHAQLEHHAAERSDIVIWDQHLTRADQLAFLSHLDVLISLHRGEGLGVHLAEAMWLGVPVMATGYSGNLDFMDDSCARLVGYSMIDVRNGGNIYPAGAQWADPDLDHAGEVMSALASDFGLRRTLGAAGRLRMKSQPDDAEVARRIISALGPDSPTNNR